MWLLNCNYLYFVFVILLFGLVTVNGCGRNNVPESNEDKVNEPRKPKRPKSEDKDKFQDYCDENYAVSGFKLTTEDLQIYCKKLNESKYSKRSRYCEWKSTCTQKRSNKKANYKTTIKSLVPRGIRQKSSNKIQIYCCKEDCMNTNCTLINKSFDSDVEALKINSKSKDEHQFLIYGAHKKQSKKKNAQVSGSYEYCEFNCTMAGGVVGGGIVGGVLAGKIVDEILNKKTTTEAPTTTTAPLNSCEIAKNEEFASVPAGCKCTEDIQCDYVGSIQMVCNAGYCTEEQACSNDDGKIVSSCAGFSVFGNSMCNVDQVLNPNQICNCVIHNANPFNQAGDMSLANPNSYCCSGLMDGVLCVRPKKCNIDIQCASSLICEKEECV